MGHIEQGGWEGFEGADTEADESSFSDIEVDRMIGGRCRREQDARKCRARRHAIRKLKVGPSALATLQLDLQ